MFLLEILLPDLGKRLFVSVDPRTKMESVIKQICKVIDPIGEKSFTDYSLIDVDEMLVTRFEASVLEAGLINGSRLLCIKKK